MRGHESRNPVFMSGSVFFREQHVVADPLPHRDEITTVFPAPYPGPLNGNDLGVVMQIHLCRFEHVPVGISPIRSPYHNNVQNNVDVRHAVK
jgi:hypothetical protein